MICKSSAIEVVLLSYSVEALYNLLETFPAISTNFAEKCFLGN